MGEIIPFPVVIIPVPDVGSRTAQKWLRGGLGARKRVAQGHLLSFHFIFFLFGILIYTEVLNRSLMKTTFSVLWFPRGYNRIR